MFNVGPAELLVIVIVTVVVIGPKDLPTALRVAGRWIGKARRVSAHFRNGLDAIVREAELAEMEKQWRAQNDEIMGHAPHEPKSKADGPATNRLTPVDALSEGASQQDSKLATYCPDHLKGHSDAV